jgi:hypothetical protein
MHVKIPTTQRHTHNHFVTRCAIFCSRLIWQSLAFELPVY